jgi:hypothetical protein
MKNDYERFDLSTLLDIYMKESKAFSVALEQGASWDTLQEKRTRIRKISALINEAYDKTSGSHRERGKPPHGD